MREPVLTVSNLCAGYGGHAVVTDVSFTLQRGEILCIVGESGSGKSTLLKALTAAPETRLLSGKIVLGDTAVSELEEKTRRKACSARMGMVFQSPGAAFNPIRSYRRQFIETLKSHGKYCPATFEQQAAEVFAKVELPDAPRVLRACPYALSGGMNQRAALALALLLEQDILLCDEPTSALDATIQRQVAQELKRLRDETGVSQIIVTHNLALARFLADRVGVLYAGRLVELGETADVLRHPQHDYTRSLMAAVPRLDDQPPQETQKAAAAVLEGNGLTKHYSGRRDAVDALRGVDIRLNRGEILGVVGESGSGKSTLLKLLSGLEPPSGGSVLLHGKELSHHRTKADCRAIQMIFQDAVASFHPRRTVADSIEDAVRSLRGRNTHTEKAALAAMVGLPPELMERYPRRLSGGQCQRFAIARAMAAEPEILLCDEITSALDVSSQAQILRLFAEICRESGTSAVFVSHDLAVVAGLCDRILVMRDGVVVEQGPTRQILNAPHEEYTRALIESVMEL